jgi:hypothetical protein
MSNHKRPSGGRTSGLLGDLESIRSLLEESEDSSRKDHEAPPESRPAGRSRPESDDSDEDVPLLQDVVHGGVSVSETFLSGQGPFDDSTGETGLNEEIFKALLSDEWRESARELLDEARMAIEQHQTDELNAALKVRIDETVQQWLREVVQTRIDDLRWQLLQALSEQIHITINAQFNQQSPDEDPDGE